MLGPETLCDRAPGYRSLDPAYTGMRDVVLDKRDMHEELSDCVIGNLAHEKVVVLLLTCVTEPRLQSHAKDLCLSKPAHQMFYLSLQALSSAASSAVAIGPNFHDQLLCAGFSCSGSSFLFVGFMPR